MKKNVVIIIVLAVCAVLLVTYFILVKSGTIKPLALALVPELSLSPSLGTFRVGQTFDVNIMIDTAGKSVDSVDIRNLNYNPKSLEVQDADTSKEGTQIKAGTLFPSYLGNNVDTVSGKIAISGMVSPGGTGFNGSGVLASVTFKVLAASASSVVNFDFVSGSTVDCNMVEHGVVQDVLSNVTNGNYVLTSPVSTPTVDLKANRKQGPVTVNAGREVILSWQSTNAKTCVASGSWSGDKSLSGSETIASVNFPENYVITCNNDQGAVSDSIQVNIRASKGRK